MGKYRLFLLVWLSSNRHCKKGRLKPFSLVFRRPLFSLYQGNSGQSDILNRNNVVFAYAAGGLYFGDIAFLFAD